MNLALVEKPNEIDEVCAHNKGPFRIVDFVVFDCLFDKRQLFIYYLVVPPNRLEVLQFRGYSRADTKSRTEQLHQRAERHAW